MNKPGRRDVRFAGILVLAIAMIACGVWMIFWSLARYEEMALSCSIPEELPLRFITMRLVLANITAVGGAGLMLGAFLRRERLRREQVARLEEEKARDEALHRKQQLAHLQRLEIVGRMTAGAAHEFNNLLTPIMGYSMMALETLSDEDTELYEDLLQIYTASQKAKAIASRLTALSRKGTEAQLRPRCPDDLIRRALEVVTPSRPKKVEIRPELGCAGLAIQADDIQMSQLLLNLFLNSFYAMQDTGGVLKLESFPQGDQAVMRISDTGTGMDETVLPHIFDAFFTTKPDDRGTGLGLAIARQIIDDHRGTVEVASEPGKGTVFTLRFPLCPAP